MKYLYIIINRYYVTELEDQEATEKPNIVECFYFKIQKICNMHIFVDVTEDSGIIEINVSNNNF